jgi:hypothetical protein
MMLPKILLEMQNLLLKAEAEIEKEPRKKD